MLNNFNFDDDDDKKKEKKNKNNFNNIMQINNYDNSDNYNNYNNYNSPSNNNEKENFCSFLFKRLTIWFNSITFIVRIIVVISMILWVLDLITIDYISFCLANIPYYTIGYFQIWRLITGNLITTGFFSLLLAIIFWVSDGMIIEKQQGSVKYFIYFLIHTTIIQVIYSLLYLFFIGISQKPNNFYSSGLWCYIICEVTINCLVSPDTKIYLLCVPYPIKAKYFPIIILFLFIIFGGFELGMLIGVVYGFLYGLFLKKYLVISDDKLKNLESNYFSSISNFGGFVRMSETSTSKQQPFIGNFTQNNNNEQQDSDSYSDDSDSHNFQNKLKKFTPFMGKGITLGTNKGHS